MLTKTFLKRCGMVGLLAFGILWTQMPVKAQEKSVREQLVEAKAAIADQVWVIEQMKDNFFKVTGQLETEIKKLRAINIEQARKIEEATNVYSRKIQELRGELDRLKAAYTDLEAVNVEQAQTIKQITDNFFKVTGEFNSKLDSLAAANASLEAANVEQAQTIKQITDNFFKITGELNSKLDSLEAANASLEAANVEQAQTIKQITDNFFKVTGELNEEVNSLKVTRDKQAATIKKLKGQRVLLGLGFLIATAVLISGCD
ncbi:MAG: hypothetical protein GH145_01620 [Firmicutes bacterium]|nr:hypothetical protein [Bacillota bacterium]